MLPLHFIFLTNYLSLAILFLLKFLVMNEYIMMIFFCIGIVLISILTNWFLLRYSGNKFSKDVPKDTLRWEMKRKPAIGGISFFVGFLIAILAFFLMTHSTEFDNTKTIAMLLCITAACILGLYDDFANAPVSVKFIVQFLIAVTLICVDIRIHITHIDAIDIILTILWVVGIINSLNMLDNMDGVTASVSICILLGILLIGSLNYNMLLLNQLIIIALICSIIGFLFFNHYPSKMYMGDIGSLILGCSLAIFSIIYLWNPPVDSHFDIHTAIRQLVCVMLLFVIPLTDTSTVFIKRIRRGQSPFKGDKGHTTHHLVYAGLHQKFVAPLYALITLAGMALALCLTYFVKQWNWPLIILSVLYCIIVWVVLFTLANKHTEKD